MMETNPRKRVRYMFDVSFSTVDKKVAFMDRLARIRKHLTPPGRPLVENRELMSMLFDKVETEATHEQATTKTFLRNGGEEISNQRRSGTCTDYLCRCLHR